MHTCQVVKLYHTSVTSSLASCCTYPVAFDDANFRDDSTTANNEITYSRVDSDEYSQNCDFVSIRMIIYGEHNHCTKYSTN